MKHSFNDTIGPRFFAVWPSGSLKLAVWSLAFLWHLDFGAWCLGSEPSPRQRLSLTSDWRFFKGDPTNTDTKLDYPALKSWLLPIADLTTNPPLARPEGNPGEDVPYSQTACDDTAWRRLNLPHDWGIEGPFKQEYPGE